MAGKLPSLPVTEVGTIIFRAVHRTYTNKTEHFKKDLCFERFEKETSIQNYSYSMHKDKTPHPFQQLHYN